MDQTQQTMSGGVPMPQDPQSFQGGGSMETPESMAGDSGASTMTPEEMSADLDQLMAAINDKYAIFNGQKGVADSQFSQMQEEAIQSLFDTLQKNGIDPSNQEEVAAFLEQLRIENPQGYQIFEQAINGILSQQQAQDMTAPPEGMTAPVPPEEQMAELPPPVPGIDMENPANQVPVAPMQ